MIVGIHLYWLLQDITDFSSITTMRSIWPHWAPISGSMEQQSHAPFGWPPWHLISEKNMYGSKWWELVAHVCLNVSWCASSYSKQKISGLLTCFSLFHFVNHDTNNWEYRKPNRQLFTQWNPVMQHKSYIIPLWQSNVRQKCMVIYIIHTGAMLSYTFTFLLEYNVKTGRRSLQTEQCLSDL